MGNHDHFPVEAYINAGFEKVYAMNMYDNIRFTHIAVHPGSMGSAAANVHGHIHAQPTFDPVLQIDNGQVLVKPYLNISMEKTNYSPLTLGQIKEMIAKIVQQWSGEKDMNGKDTKIQTTPEADSTT